MIIVTDTKPFFSVKEREEGKKEVSEENDGRCGRTKEQAEQWPKIAERNQQRQSRVEGLR